MINSSGSPLPATSPDPKAGRIVEAALAEFSRRGYRTASETGIARRAGVAFATLRRHFPTKAALFREVVRTTLIEAISGLTAGDRSGPVGDAERLRAFATGYLRLLSRSDLAALGRLSISELHHFPELATFFATEVIERPAARLERTLTHGVGTGEFRPLDGPTWARLIVAMLLTYAQWIAAPSWYGRVVGAGRDCPEVPIAALIDGLRDHRESGGRFSRERT